MIELHCVPPLFHSLGLMQYLEHEGLMEGIMELLFTRCCKIQDNTRCWKGGTKKIVDRHERQLILPSVFLLRKIL